MHFVLTLAWRVRLGGCPCRLPHAEPPVCPHRHTALRSAASLGPSASLSIHNTAGVILSLFTVDDKVRCLCAPGNDMRGWRGDLPPFLPPFPGGPSPPVHRGVYRLHSRWPGHCGASEHSYRSGVPSAVPQCRAGRGGGGQGAPVADGGALSARCPPHTGTPSRTIPPPIAPPPTLDHMT